MQNQQETRSLLTNSNRPNQLINGTMDALHRRISNLIAEPSDIEARQKNWVQTVTTWLTCSDIKDPIEQKAARGQRMIQIVGLVTSISQALIYIDPGKKAVTESDTIDWMFQDAPRNILTAFVADLLKGYVIFTGASSNFLLGYACTLQQFYKVFRNAFQYESDETLFLWNDSKPTSEKVKNLSLEVAAFSMAFISTFAFFELGLDDDFVKNQPDVIKVLYSGWNSMVCLTPVHWQGLAEWVGIINKFRVWKDRFTHPDTYATELARRSFVQGLDDAHQGFLRLGKEKGIAEGIAWGEQLHLAFLGDPEDPLNKNIQVRRYLMHMYELAPGIADFNEHIKGKIEQRYKILDNEANQRLTPLAKMQLLNARGYFERLGDYFRTHSIAHWIKDATWFSLWFAPFNLAVNLSLLGYASKAAEAMGPVIGFLVMTALVGLCIKSAPGGAIGIWETLKCCVSEESKAKRRITISTVLMPKLEKAMSLMSLILCAGSGGTNAEVNEGFANPIQDGSLILPNFLLWLASWVSSPVVNGWYGKDVLRAFGEAIGVNFLSEDAKKFKAISDEFEAMKTILNEMSRTSVHTLLQEMFDSPEGADMMEKLLTLGGMSAEQIAIVRRGPEAKPNQSIFRKCCPVTLFGSKHEAKYEPFDLGHAAPAPTSRCAIM